MFRKLIAWFKRATAPEGAMVSVEIFQQMVREHNMRTATATATSKVVVKGFTLERLQG